MQKRECGKSGIEISVLGIGCWVFGGNENDYWGHHDQHDADAVVNGALEREVNFFDTAPVYNNGRSETILGKLLSKKRNEAIIGTKLPPEKGNPTLLRQTLEESLSRLQTDYIDIYMIHWPIRDYPVDDVFATLTDLKKEGKIRAIGVSNYGVKDLDEALATGAQIEVNQLMYNLLSRAIEKEIVPLCERHQIGILSYMPLLQGILSGKYAGFDEIPSNRTRTRHFSSTRPESRHGEPGAEDQMRHALERIRNISEKEGYNMGQLALAWTAHKPAVVSTLVGTRNLKQLEENCKAISLSVPPEIIVALDKATEELRQKMGRNADYWQPSSESRIQ